jgi:hypothetical protein
LGVYEGYSQLKEEMALIQGIIKAFEKYETTCTIVDRVRARPIWLVTVVKALAFGEVVFLRSSFSWRVSGAGCTVAHEMQRRRFYGAHDFWRRGFLSGAVS